MNDILAAILAVSSWAAPQPQLSQGLLVVYGNQQLVEANARWHGYDLSKVPGRCGLASISPMELGKLAWVSVDRRLWLGPCIVVDVQGRDDALDSIYRRHEIAEVSRQMAAVLGFTHGAPGFVYFGQCPPSGWVAPERYAPPLQLDYWPYSHTPSFWPYPPQERMAWSCGEGRLN